MKKVLHHFFLPLETNNYRPALLHHKLLLFFTLFFLSAGILVSQIKENYPAVLGISSDMSSQQLLLKTNEKRQESGLPPLALDGELSQAAANKAIDMFSKNYWAHISPDGTTPWIFIKQSGYSYIYAGENLARGYNSASDVINAWMASPEHKDNMLSQNYKNVGFAVSEGKLNGEDTILVVEMLGSTSLVASAPIQEEQSVQENLNVQSAEKTAEVSTNNPEPQPIPTVVAQNQQNTLAIAKVKTDLNSQNSEIIPANSKVLINSQTFSLSIAKMFVALFMFILFLDMILIERKKIIRFVGHNLDHVFFLSLILLAIIIFARGRVI